MIKKNLATYSVFRVLQTGPYRTSYTIKLARNFFFRLASSSFSSQYRSIVFVKEQLFPDISFTKTFSCGRRRSPIHSNFLSDFLTPEEIYMQSPLCIAAFKRDLSGLQRQIYIKMAAAVESPFSMHPLYPGRKEKEEFSET